MISTFLLNKNKKSEITLVDPHKKPVHYKKFILGPLISSMINKKKLMTYIVRCLLNRSL